MTGTARAEDAGRVLGYGAVATIDRRLAAPDALAESQPDGIDILIDVASDGDTFAALASQVRSGGAALTTKHVADQRALAERDVTGINFRVSMSPRRSSASVTSSPADGSCRRRSRRSPSTRSPRCGAATAPQR